MEKNFFIFLIIGLFILYNTYDGYRNQRNIIISFFTSIILTFGNCLSLLAWGAFFLYGLRYGQDISWWIKGPLIPIACFAMVLISVFIAAPFWGIHDNYIKDGKLGFEKIPEKINKIIFKLKNLFSKK